MHQNNISSRESHLIAHSNTDADDHSDDHSDEIQYRYRSSVELQNGTEEYNREDSPLPSEIDQGHLDGIGLDSESDRADSMDLETRQRREAEILQELHLMENVNQKIRAV